MKKVIIVSLLSLLVGCGESGTEASERSLRTGRIEFISEAGNGIRPIYIFSDLETGCQYFITGDKITPVMGPDGKQLCERRL